MCDICESHVRRIPPIIRIYETWNFSYAAISRQHKIFSKIVERAIITSPKTYYTDQAHSRRRRCKNHRNKFINATKFQILNTHSLTSHRISYRVHAGTSGDSVDCRTNHTRMIFMNRTIICSCLYGKLELPAPNLFNPPCRQRQFFSDGIGLSRTLFNRIRLQSVTLLSGDIARCTLRQESVLVQTKYRMHARLLTC